MRRSNGRFGDKENKQRDFSNLSSGLADFEDGGTEALGLFRADAADGLQLCDSLWLGEDDAAQGGRAENKELRQAELFGFGLAPVAEALIEHLLRGGEGLGGFGWSRAMPLEGLGRLLR